MVRRRRNAEAAVTPAEEVITAEPVVETPTPEVSEWTTTAHSDGDVRIPKTLRAKLGIAGHSKWTIIIVAEDAESFTLLFRKSA